MSGRREQPPPSGTDTRSRTEQKIYLGVSHMVLQFARYTATKKHEPPRPKPIHMYVCRHTKLDADSCVAAATRCLESIVRRFGGFVRDTLAAPMAAGRVDLAREGRVARCREAHRVRRGGNTRKKGLRISRGLLQFKRELIHRKKRLLEPVSEHLRYQHTFVWHFFFDA